MCMHGRCCSKRAFIHTFVSPAKFTQLPSGVELTRSSNKKRYMFVDRPVQIGVRSISRTRFCVSGWDCDPLKYASLHPAGFSAPMLLRQTPPSEVGHLVVAADWS